MLGVSWVAVYNLSLDRTSETVLRYYAARGLIDLHKTDAIEPRGYQHYWLHNSPTINNCLYRNMFRARRLLVIDFDEVILPEVHDNLHALIRDIDSMMASQQQLRKQPIAVNYDFRNSYFFLDLPANESHPNV